MSYNLLKSLYIKAGKTDFEYTVNLAQEGCNFSFYKGHNSLYTVDLAFNYAPDVKIGFSPKKSSKVTDVSYILNNNIKGTIKENGFDSLASLLASFDNVISWGYTFDIFQVDDFSLKLSQELYSVPANMSDKEFDKYGYHCYHFEKLSDFGVANPGSSLSIIEIALKLIDDKNILYRDEYGKKYKIVLTDRGKALITKYRIAKSLDKDPFWGM